MKYDFTRMLIILPCIFLKAENSIFKAFAKQWSHNLAIFLSIHRQRCTKFAGEREICMDFRFIASSCKKLLE